MKKAFLFLLFSDSLITCSSLPGFQDIMSFPFYIGIGVIFVQVMFKQPFI